MTAWVSSMLAACATAPRDLRVRMFRHPCWHCDCEGNQLDALDVCAHALRTPMRTICDDVDECVGELDAAACATAPARSTSADVQTFQQRLRL